MPCSDTHFIPILDEIRARDTANNPPPDPLRRKRGGKRAGAGAPKGNLNGLKTGRHSKVYKQLAQALIETPEAHQLLLRIAKRQRKVDKEKEFGASQLTAEILRRVGEIVIDPESNQSESNLEFLNVLRLAEARIRRKLEFQSKTDPEIRNPIKPAADAS
jgi:hypothetical protein